MSDGETLQGLAISPGVALGPVLFLRSEVEEVPRRQIGEGQIEAEVERFRAAIQEAEDEFRRQRDEFAENFQGPEERIFEAHLLLYQDTWFKDAVEEQIRSNHTNAEAAILEQIRHFAAALSKSSALFRERIADVRDIGNRINRVLLNRQQEPLASGKQSFVLYARELLPSDTMSLDRSRLLAIVTEVGGEASHVAILARAFGIPAVTGIERLESRIPPGMPVAVDGNTGRVLVVPSEQQRSILTAAREKYLERRSKLQSTSAEMLRGEQEAGISVLLNIENFDALDASILPTTKGVGLYRTEFLFMGRKSFPSEEEQYEFYTDVLSRTEGRDVTFRTIDVGGDKPLSYLSVPREANPVLGWRGIRLTFEWPDLLIPQLRALLRASAHGPLKIMLPMITHVEELRQVRELVDRLRRDLDQQGIAIGAEVPLGAMIEVPAAALAASDLAAEADFLSVGTNDLVQYLFAVDRNNLRVADLYQPLHPVMLRLLRDIIRAGEARSCPVTVCGEMAGQPLSVLALLGLGLRRFSMSPAHLPETRWVLPLFRPEEAEALLNAALTLKTEGEVVVLLRQALADRAGSDQEF